MKRTRVGNERRINTLGYLFGDAHPGRLTEVIDHLAHR